MSYIPSFVIYTLKPQIFILTEGDTLGGAITDYIYLPQTTVQPLLTWSLSSNEFLGIPPGKPGIPLDILWFSVVESDLDFVGI